MNNKPIDTITKCTFPELLNEPEQEVELFWTTEGEWTGDESSACNSWMEVYATQEEAEAASSIPQKDWIWDGNPAIGEPLAAHMRDARHEGMHGVKVCAYRDNAWVVVKEYPCGVPLL